MFTECATSPHSQPPLGTHWGYLTSSGSQAVREYRCLFLQSREEWTYSLLPLLRQSSTLRAGWRPKMTVSPLPAPPTFACKPLWKYSNSTNNTKHVYTSDRIMCCVRSLRIQGRSAEQSRPDTTPWCAYDSVFSM